MGKVSQERRAAKEALVAEMSRDMRGAPSTIMANYRGLSVQEDTDLRRRLRVAGVRYRVVKNTVLHRAADDAGFPGLGVLCEGPTAVAFGTDVVMAARELRAFAKDHPQLELKGGLLEGQVIDRTGAERLAELPTREVLLAQVAGSMLAPLQGVASILAAPLRALAVVISQVAQSRGA